MTMFSAWNRRRAFTGRGSVWLVTAAMVLAALVALPVVSRGANAEAASPIYGVTIPDGYRQWELVAPSQETEPLNELRAILGNQLALTAYRQAALPFPDGTILVKLAWKHVVSTEFKAAFVPARPPRFRSWSRIRRNTPPPGDGGSAGSSTANRSMRRSTPRASAAIRPTSDSTTWSSRDWRPERCATSEQPPAR